MSISFPVEAYQLGQPIAEYKGHSNIKGGTIAAVVGLVFLLLGCQFSSSLILLGIAGMILLPFGAFIAFYGLTQRGLRVILCTDGFIYQQPKKTLVIPWSDIKGVHKRITQNFINLIYAGKTYTYTIHTTAGISLVLDDNLARIEELGDTIQQMVARYNAAQSGVVALQS